MDNDNLAFVDIDRQIDELKAERDEVLKELANFQKTYDEEVSGVRSGVAGEGPLARQILQDDIAPRNKELQRIRNDLSDLTRKRNRISVSLVEDRAALERERQLIAKQGLEKFKETQEERVNIMTQKI